ncbi:MAG: ATP-binding protein, partial [Desulfatitalea sp.]
LLQSTVEDLRQWDPRRPVEEDLIDDLAFADKELARAKSIVASLLGLARQTQTYEESVDLNLLVRDTLRVLYNQYKHTPLNIVEALDDHLPPLRGNFANLGQVVLNIIQNAIQAVADPDGKIVLSTQYDSERRQVVLRCQDNGPGIAAAIRHDVFKPFFTTKPVGQGTGLGLYICHQIVQKHNGTIALEAAEPRGTVVVVRLPVSATLTTFGG